MRILDHAAAIAAAPSNTCLNLAVRQLLAERVPDWAQAGVLGLTCVIIMDRGDTDQDLVSEIGQSLLFNPMDGRRFGQEGFVPPFEHAVSRDDGLVEIVACVGNDGFAYWVVLTPEVADPQLRALCRTYAAPSNASEGE